VEKNKALFFEKPKGYSIPVAAGLLDSRNRYYLATVIWKSVPSIVKFDLSQKEGNQNGL
jgi:3-polyprenyl-4-hydroxybenzoate decarboxylase